MAMTEQTDRTRKWLAALCVSVMWAGGCFTRKTPTKPVVDFIGVVRPVMPTATEVALESPPEVAMEPPVGPPQIGPSYAAPPRPRVATRTAPEPQETEKRVEPLMAPELTPAEMVAAKAETQRNLELAEKNLLMARGRRLNATQADLAAKARGFSDNAREAMQSEDWVRAKNLSKKAQVLSEELAASL